MIRCFEVKKTFPGKPPVEALRGIDLEILAGECYGILGPNGAGKTTLIEIFEGLSSPTSGVVEVFGETWDKGARFIRERIGITLQDTQFAEKLTVTEIVRLFRSLYPDGVTPEEAIDRVSLGSKAHSRYETLSGGQKQRLAIATSIVGDPEALFLDEPTTGLDPSARRDLWEVIQRFKNEGRTTLLTTHYLEEAERLCDRVAIIDEGRVIAMGTPDGLISEYGGGHVIEFSLDRGNSDIAVLGALRELPGVALVSSESSGYRITSTEPHRTAPAIYEMARNFNQELTRLATRNANLEDVFIKITGRRFTEINEAL